MKNWNHPLRTIWRIGRDAHHASAAAWIIALVALGLVLPAGVVRCRLITLRVQVEETPDSQTPAEETNGALGLATGQQRRTGKDHSHIRSKVGRELTALHCSRLRSTHPHPSLRSRCSERVALNGCGVSLRC